MRQQTDLSHRELKAAASLISGPGSMRRQSEWTHAGLKAAASLMRQWYRPMLIIWAVDAPSLQGAAAASAGNGFACHINCVLLPKRVLQPSPSDQVQLKKDKFASCEAPSNLPPLILEGTGVANQCLYMACTVLTRKCKDT